MTARELLYAPGGTLRAPWRMAGALLVGSAAFSIFVAVAAPLWPHWGIYWLAAFSAAAWLAATVLAHVVMLRAVDKRPWSSVGLGAAQARPVLVAAGIALGALGILLPSGALLLAHGLRVGAPVAASGTWGGGALKLAVVLLPAALAEEMLTRGYLFTVLRESAGPFAAVVVTSLGFSALHLGNPGFDLRSFVLVALAGVWLAMILVVTGSLWAAVAAHFAWNWSMAALLHAPVSGIVFPASGYVMVSDGPAWLTGGSWGPEGGAGAALGMLGGIAALALWRRRTAPGGLARG